MNNRYALIAGFAICLIVMSWIFFTSISASAIAAPADQGNSQNYLKRQIPRDNDANYRLPTYIPTHSKSVPRKKIEFKDGADNDALYYTPVDIPKDVPKNRAAKQVTTPRPAPQVYQPATQAVEPAQPQYQQPTAPLQPQPRQPRAPVYVPQYQQQPVQQPRSIYVPPARQEQAPVEDYYPLYYY